MSDDAREEQAALYALEMLSEPEATEFRAAMERDPGLRALVDELQEAAAALVHALPPAEAPSGVLGRILAAHDADRSASLVSVIPPSSSDNFRWALAASVVFALGLLAFTALETRKMSAVLREQHAGEAARRSELLAQAETAEAAQRALGEKVEVVMTEQRLFGEKLAQLEAERQRLLAERETLQQQVTELQTRDALSRVKIATLKAQLDTYAQVVAVAVWDAEHQSGVITIDHLPRPAADKDYQLWVIDPRYPAPVSAGVVPQSGSDSLRVSFKPAAPIGAADKFAISLEKKGGSLTAQGAIVLLSK